MKRPAILLAILLLASPLYAALKHTNTVYLNGSWPQFHVEKSLYETEQEWFYPYENEQSTTPTNMTGWTALYYYSNVSDPGATTVPMRIMTGTVSTTYITFTPSATEFSSVIQGGYAALVFVKDDERITFARGKHTTLASPENQTGVSFEGVTNINWASFGTYSHTSTHGPNRPDWTTLIAVTNADGSLTWSATGTATSSVATTAALVSFTDDTYTNVQDALAGSLAATNDLNGRMVTVEGYTNAAAAWGVVSNATLTDIEYLKGYTNSTASTLQQVVDNGNTATSSVIMTTLYVENLSITSTFQPTNQADTAGLIGNFGAYIEN